MHERTLGRQLLDSDAISEPEMFRECCESPKVLAADAFGLFLKKLHAGKTDPRRFAVVGYAALWHLRPDEFKGLTQRDLAKSLRVSPENFNRAVRRWAVEIGYQSPGMRVRRGTRAAIKARRIGSP